MFNLGMGEMILIAVFALVFIGPKQLPEVAHSIGKFLNELKRASEGLTGPLLTAKNRVDNEVRGFEGKINQTIKSELSGLNNSIFSKDQLIPPTRPVAGDRVIPGAPEGAKISDAGLRSRTLRADLFRDIDRLDGQG